MTDIDLDEYPGGSEEDSSKVKIPTRPPGFSSDLDAAQVAALNAARKFNDEFQELNRALDQHKADKSEVVRLWAKVKPQFDTLAKVMTKYEIAAGARVDPSKDPYVK